MESENQLFRVVTRDGMRQSKPSSRKQIQEAYYAGRLEGDWVVQSLATDNTIGLSDFILNDDLTEDVPLAQKETRIATRHRLHATNRKAAFLISIGFLVTLILLSAAAYQFARPVNTDAHFQERLNALPPEALVCLKFLEGDESILAAESFEVVNIFSSRMRRQHAPDDLKNVVRIWRTLLDKFIAQRRAGKAGYRYEGDDVAGRIMLCDESGTIGTIKVVNERGNWVVDEH